MARLLIIAYYFPPLNTIASLRPMAWVKYWTRAGHELAVVTAEKSQRDGSLDLSLDPEAASAVRVVEVPYLSTRMTPGAPPPGHGDAPVRPREISAAAKARALMRKACRVMGVDPLSPQTWIWGGVAAALDMHKRWPYDVVVSTFGPPACHVIAAVVKRKLPVLWVADYRDLWNDSHLDRGAWPFSLIERSIENVVMKKADLIATVSDPWRDILEKRFARGVLTVPNGFDHEDLVGLGDEQAFPKDGKIRLVYTGTLYPEAQTPEPLFQALALLRSRGVPINQHFEALFFGVKEHDLSKLIGKYGLQGLVQPREYVTRRSALRIQRDADLLIFLDWLDSDYPGVMPGKLFEYSYAGVPVLCIGPEADTSAVRFIKESGIGVAAGMSGDLIAGILGKLLRGERPSCTSRPEVLARFTREHISGFFLAEILKRLAENRPSRLG